jgi:ribose 5-phosphate isomerase B
MKTVYLGADHAGFVMKHAVVDSLRVLGYDVEDLGAHTLAPDDDYPEYAARVADAVKKHPGSFGVLLCGSAEGMCMAANKFHGIRAGVGFSLEAAKLMRTDDDANIVCVPTRISVDDNPMEIVKTFLETQFSGEVRHARRIAEIE